MTTHSTSPAPRLAQVVTEVTAPAPTALALLLVVAWHSSPSRWAAVAWGTVAVVFASLLPLAFILRGVRTGRWSDRHVSQHTQRRLPLAVGIASVTAGLVLLAAGGAPRQLLALVAAMLTGLASTLLVSLYWKLSIHTAVVAGAATILCLVFGLALLVLAPAVALVAWSRVALKDHTWPQTAAGAALGVLAAAAVFPALT